MLYGACFFRGYGFTGEGWFHLCIPALFLKKGYGSAGYIRFFLYPVMQEYFQGKNQCEEDSMQKFFRVFWKSGIKRGKGIPDPLFLLWDNPLGAEQKRHAFLERRGSQPPHI